MIEKLKPRESFPDEFWAADDLLRAQGLMLPQDFLRPIMTLEHPRILVAMDRLGIIGFPATALSLNNVISNEADAGARPISISKIQRLLGGLRIRGVVRSAGLVELQDGLKRVSFEPTDLGIDMIHLLKQ